MNRHEEKLKIKCHMVFMNRLNMHIYKEKNGENLHGLFRKDLINTCFVTSPGHSQWNEMFELKIKSLQIKANTSIHKRVTLQMSAIPLRSVMTSVESLELQIILERRVTVSSSPPSRQTGNPEAWLPWCFSSEVSPWQACSGLEFLETEVGKYQMKGSFGTKISKGGQSQTRFFYHANDII